MKFHHNRCLSDQDVYSFIIHLEKMGYYAAEWDFTAEGNLDKLGYVCGESFVCIYTHPWYKIILVATGEVPLGECFITERGNRIPIA